MIRRALDYMLPQGERWPMLALSLCMSAASVIGTYSVPPAAAETGPSQRIEEDEPGWDCLRHGNRMCGVPEEPGYVLCGSPNVRITFSECEALMQESEGELPATE